LIEAVRTEFLEQKPIFSCKKKVDAEDEAKNNENIIEDGI